MDTATITQIVVAACAFVTATIALTSHVSKRNKEKKEALLKEIEQRIREQQSNR